MTAIKITIFRDGVSKENRSLPALDPDQVQLADRSLKDQLDSTRVLSQEVAYYNLNNTRDGNWLPFFDFPDDTVLEKNLNYLLELPEQEYALITKRNTTPHLAVFFTFLALVEKLKSTINKIPRRHFGYFINQILQLKPKQGIPDRAIVTLELAETAAPFKLGQGTLFLAGKGFDEQDIFYESEREIIVNHARITDWRTSYRNPAEFSNIYITAPALLIKELAPKAVPEERGWMAFSEGRLKDAGLITVPAEIGWAIESPCLYMQEGERSLVIEILIDWLTTVPPFIDKTPIPLEAYLTTGKGWMQADVRISEFREFPNPADPINPLRFIIVTVQVPPQFPAVVPGNDFLGSLSTKWPLLKLILPADNTSPTYESLKFAGVKEIKLTVTVQGMRNVVLQAPTGQANAAGAFLPFGTNPVRDARLYIGVNELRYKSIEHINIAYKWKGAPSDFGDYYKEYFYKSTGARPTPIEIPINNSSYKGRLELLRNGIWTALESNNIFPGNPVTEERAWDRFDFLAAQPTERAAGITDIVPLNNFPVSGYWALAFETLINNSTFNGPLAFGQNEFPKILSEIATGKAANVPIYQTVNLPNQPYTPEIEYLTVNYRAVESFKTFSSDADNRLFHVSPFGISEPDSASNQVIPLHTQEGFLYMGIEGWDVPGNLTILFHVKEKGADTDLDTSYFSWSYLSDNKWVNLNKQNVVIDQTFGLKISGVVELSIPSDASTQHTMMPEGKSWIRLGILKDPHKSNTLINLTTQAISVVYKGSTGNKPTMLPAGSINALVNNTGEIKTIEQPFQSFGGQDTEPVELIELRTQERLRHRERSVNFWDYERLVLDNFSEIYKAKTIQCTDKDKRKSPGHVTVIVIPDQRGNNVLEPKCSQLLLQKIENFMSGKAQPGVTLHAVNPTYETVYFDFYVSFLPGLDPGFYQQLLNKELKAYVSPWAFDSNEEIFFGSIFFKTDIIKFIESREYVDFITKFEMYSLGGESALFGIGDMKITATGDLEELDDFIIGEDFHPGLDDMAIEDNFIVGPSVEVAVASTASGILVSAQNHRIRIIEDGTNVCAPALSGIGIGSMAIEIDFIVT